MTGRGAEIGTRYWKCAGRNQDECARSTRRCASPLRSPRISGPFGDEPRRSTARALGARSRLICVVAVYTLFEAWRSRLPGLVVAFLVATLVVAQVVQEVALTEALETRNVIHAAILRSGAVLTIALFVVASVVREGIDRVVEVVLSQPRPRADYYFGKLAAGVALGGGLAALCGLCLLTHAPPSRVLPWSASLALELWIVVAASLFFVLAFRQVLSALLAVSAFYLLGRFVGALRLLSESPLTASPGRSDGVIDVVVKALYHLLPDLGLYASSDWLAYSSAGAGTLLLPAAQAVVWMAVLSGAALFDLHRRNL